MPPIYLSIFGHLRVKFRSLFAMSLSPFSAGWVVAPPGGRLGFGLGEHKYCTPPVWGLRIAGALRLELFPLIHGRGGTEIEVGWVVADSRESKEASGR